jgi:hypothetical protein
MLSSPEDMQELRKQLEKGSIQKAYRAILAYMMSLRTRFTDKYSENSVSSLYLGYMDMTYFAIFPPALKPHDLKVAIVFNYDAFRFELWLAARNRKIQRQFWELFKDSRWPAYQVVAPASGVDAIVEYDLAGDFDLSDPDALTFKIENAAAAFIDNIERYINSHQPETS